MASQITVAGFEALLVNLEQMKIEYGTVMDPDDTYNVMLSILHGLHLPYEKEYNYQRMVSQACHNDQPTKPRFKPGDKFVTKNEAANEELYIESIDQDFSSNKQYWMVDPYTTTGIPLFEIDLIRDFKQVKD